MGVSSISGNQMNIHGMEGIQIETSGTSPEVQQAWSEQMAIITDVMSKVDAKTCTGDDLNRLVSALKALDSIAKNGVKGADGQTRYLTSTMANSLDVLLIEFSKYGIKPNMNLDTMSSQQKIDQLLKISGDEALKLAVTGANNLSFEDLDLQHLIHAVMMNQVFPAYNEKFKDLSDYMEVTEKIMSSLETMQKITTFVTSSAPWSYSMDLKNSGNIPPEAVNEIQKYIEANGANKDEKKFSQIYWSEYNQAQANAARNGTTVEYEMSKFTGASDCLKHFVSWDGKKNTRFDDIASIMAKTEVKEVTGVPAAPKGKSMSEVGLDLAQARKDLDASIEFLKSQKADPKMISSLEQVAKDIDDSWNKALAENGWKPMPMKDFLDGNIAGLDTNRKNNVLASFAKNYIQNSNKSGSGGSASSHLTEAIQRTQTLDEDQQKEFKKLTTALDQIIKVVGMLLKTINDIYGKIISHANR